MGGHFTPPTWQARHEQTHVRRQTRRFTRHSFLGGAIMSVAIKSYQIEPLCADSRTLLVIQGRHFPIG